jgi:hypothetical protein
MYSTAFEKLFCTDEFRKLFRSENRLADCGSLGSELSSGEWPAALGHIKF